LWQSEENEVVVQWHNLMLDHSKDDIPAQNSIK
jgi:hypothetical protein